MVPSHDHGPLERVSPYIPYSPPWLVSHTLFVSLPATTLYVQLVQNYSTSEGMAGSPFVYRCTD